jgi:hypothetical protein
MYDKACHLVPQVEHGKEGEYHNIMSIANSSWYNESQVKQLCGKILMRTLHKPEEKSDNVKHVWITFACLGPAIPKKSHEKFQIRQQCISEAAKTERYNTKYFNKWNVETWMSRML